MWEGFYMGLTAVLADTGTETEQPDLFRRMNTLLESMNNRMKEGIIMPSDRESFLDLYIREREKLSAWEREAIDKTWNEISHSDKYLACFGDNIHNGQDEYNPFTR